MRIPAIASAAAIAALVATEASAGDIGRACLRANRAAATPALCGCIDRVAQSALTRSERRKVARFFDNPHRSQMLRSSDRPADAKLWDRYVAFGELAQESCD